MNKIVDAIVQGNRPIDLLVFGVIFSLALIVLAYWLLKFLIKNLRIVIRGYEPKYTYSEEDEQINDLIDEKLHAYHRTCHEGTKAHPVETCPCAACKIVRDAVFQEALKAVRNES